MVLSYCPPPGLNWWPDQIVVESFVQDSAGTAPITRGQLCQFDMNGAAQGAEGFAANEITLEYGSNATLLADGSNTHPFHPHNNVRPAIGGATLQDQVYFCVALSSGEIGDRVTLGLSGIFQVAADADVDLGNFIGPLAGGGSRVDQKTLSALLPVIVLGRALEDCANDGDLIWVMFDGAMGCGTTAAFY